MNKQQIIAPLGLMGIVALFGMISFTRSQSESFAYAYAGKVAHEIITTTNSSHLDSVQPEIRAQLDQFLSPGAKVERILLGDEPSPTGDGEANFRIVLRDMSDSRLALRFRRIGNDQCEILGCWTPAAPVTK
jgi:hypothetical protein